VQDGCPVHDSDLSVTKLFLTWYDIALMNYPDYIIIFYDYQCLLDTHRSTHTHTHTPLPSVDKEALMV